VVDEDTAQLIAETIQLFELTNGFFCPLIAPLLDLWGFSSPQPRVPAQEMVRETIEEIAESRLSLQGREVSLSGEGKLDLGGSAKGYLVDVLTTFLTGRGVRKFLINAGGQVLGFGKPWRVGIFDPVNEKVAGYIIIENTSVSTSGDYFRFFEEGGVRYHHILNPFTGYPGRDFRSVSVVAKRALVADVLSTAILAGGREALYLILERFPEIKVLTIDAQGNWEFFSKGKKGNGFFFVTR